MSSNVLERMALSWAIISRVASCVAFVMRCAPVSKAADVWPGPIAPILAMLEAQMDWDKVKYCSKRCASERGKAKPAR